MKGLARLAARGALVLRADGARHYLPVSELEPGMTILLAAGERVPVDARVASGRSDLDCSLVSGESAPQPVAPGAMLRAGTLNLTGPLTITATAAAKDSFLAEMVRLMEAAEARQVRLSPHRRPRRAALRARRSSDGAAQLPRLDARDRRCAPRDHDRDRRAHHHLPLRARPRRADGPGRRRAPPVRERHHGEGRLGHGASRRDRHHCPRQDRRSDPWQRCALPMPPRSRPDDLAIASAIAVHSRHPHARALADGRHRRISLFDEVAEHPGLGLEAASGKTVYRLGRAGWALGDEERHRAATGTVLSRDGQLIEAFRFEDQIRPGARQAIAQLTKSGLDVEIVSGDRPSAGPAARLRARRPALPGRGPAAPTRPRGSPRSPPRDARC